MRLSKSKNIYIPKHTQPWEFQIFPLFWWKKLRFTKNAVLLLISSWSVEPLYWFNSQCLTFLIWKSIVILCAYNLIVIFKRIISMYIPVQTIASAAGRGLTGEGRLAFIICCCPSSLQEGKSSSNSKNNDLLCTGYCLRRSSQHAMFKPHNNTESGTTPTAWMMNPRHRA